MLAYVGGLFGLIVGSFLNVVILRHGVRTLGGRSACPHCNHQLHVSDLIPVFSWLYLRGACRYCRSSISIQYPLVEAVTALVCAVLFMAAPNIYVLACGIVIASLLVCIAAYDIKHTIIPDGWVYGFAIAAVVYHLPTLFLPGVFMGIAAGAIAAATPLFMLWLISRGRWMGFGDVKLALGIGLLLGFPDGLTAIMASFVIGSVIMVPMLLAGQLQQRFTHRDPFLASRFGLTMKSEVPFGPFLIVSCLIFWILQWYGIPVSFAWLSIA
jgi:leader peptidase (prepilin peptidase)/N-methyltransferase